MNDRFAVALTFLATVVSSVFIHASIIYPHWIAVGGVSEFVHGIGLLLEMLAFAFIARWLTRAPNITFVVMWTTFSAVGGFVFLSQHSLYGATLFGFHPYEYIAILVTAFFAGIFSIFSVWYANRWGRNQELVPL